MSPEDFEAKCQRIYDEMTGKSADPLPPNEKIILAEALHMVAAIGGALLRIADAADAVSRQGVGIKDKHASRDPFDDLL